MTTTLNELPDQAAAACLANLDTVALARLATCSRSLSDIVTAYIRHSPLDVLVDAVLATIGLATSHSHRQQKAVAWLVAVVPPTAIAACIPELLRLPNVPLEMVQLLAGPGIHVSFSQLAASAAAGVPGVEVWCKVCPIMVETIPQDDGLKTDLHVETILEQAADVRSFGRLSSISVAHPKELPGLLQLIVNMTSEVAAVNLLLSVFSFNNVSGWPLQFNNPSFVTQLLQIALTRRHDRSRPNALRMLAESIPGAQKISAETAGQLLQAAVQYKCRDPGCLMALPAVQQLDSSTVITLMQQAVQMNNSTVFGTLCGLPAAQHITADTVSMLLTDIVRHRSKDMLQFIPRLPAAKFLTSEVVAEAVASRLRTYLPTDTCTPLYELPATKQLNGDEAARVLQAAVEAQSDDSVALVCDGVPAVQQLQTEVLVAAITTALAPNYSGIGVMATLCSITGVQQFNPSTVAGLLDTALKMGSQYATVLHVVALPAAKQLSAEVVLQLIETAIEWGASYCLDRLCGLLHHSGASSIPSAMDLGPVTYFGHVGGKAYRLMHAAIAMGGSGVPELLPLLQQQLLAHDASHLLLLAIQAQQYESVSALSQLSVLHELPSTSVEQLLQSAVQHGVLHGVAGYALKQLSDASATGMNSYVGEQLLDAAQYKLASSKSHDMFTIVCSLDVVRQVSNLDLVVKVLHKAIRLHDHDAATPLIGLPVLQQLDTATAATLLLAIVGSCRIEHSKKAHMLSELTRLSAARELSAADIECILHCLAKDCTWGTSSCDAIMQLLSCPAAQNVSSAVMLAILDTTLDNWDEKFLYKLCRSPVVQELGPTDVWSLLSGIHLHNMISEDLECIFMLPASKQWDMSHLEELKSLATRLASAKVVIFLRREIARSLVACDSLTM